MEPRGWSVGVDQGSKEHVVVVVDPGGEVAGRRSFPHAEEGVRRMAAWVEEVTGGLEGVVVGTETPWGPVVETFLLTPARVFHLNPKQLDRFRDRFSVAGAKDDPLDALVLAQTVATDRPHFHEVERPSALRFQLRALSRLRKELVQDVGCCANRLRAVLQEVWPDLLALCRGANERWLWSLLERAPEAARARRLRLTTLEKLLRSHRIRRFDGDALQEVLRRPSVATAPGHWQAARYQIKVLVQQIQLLDEQLRATERQLRELLAEHSAEELASRPPGDGPSDVEILLSPPGLGPVTVATLLGELGPKHLRDYEHSRKLTGCAPVQRASGTTRRVFRRRACNSRLQNAMHSWASNARLKEAWVADRYQALRSRGHTHGRALRQLGDSLLAVLAATLRDRTLYRSDHPRKGARSSEEGQRLRHN